jgi:aspartate racemase
MQQPTTAHDLVIGIIGGMGPEATVELMRRIIARTPAQDDSDHVRMIVDCNPKVPSRLAFLLEGGTVDPTATLVEMARGLVRLGATVLAMPCNTAHAFAGPIRSSLQTPFVDILEAAFAALHQRVGTDGPISFGVLGSPALRRIGLLEQRTKNTQFRPVHPDERHEDLALKLIRSVKAGDKSASVLDQYGQLKRHLVQQGAQHTLVCCTEFSVLEELQPPGERATLDTLDALVDALLQPEAGR